MKNENLKKYSFFALLVILVLLSLVVAVFVYLQYPIVSRGIIGIAAFYSMSSLEKKLKLANSFEDILLDTKKGKYIIAAFVWPIISGWCIGQILEMILFFFRNN